MNSKTNENSVFFHKACFLIFGICGTIPWFSIFSTLDFFVHHYSEFNAPLTIRIPFFFGQGVFCILMYFLSFIVSLKARVFGSLSSLVAILISIFIIPILSPNQEFYWLILFLLFCLGNVAIIYQTSVIALTYIFPKEYRPFFFLGNSFSGVIMIFVRFFCVLGINFLLLIGAMLLYQKLTTTTLYFSCIYREYRQSLAYTIVGYHPNDFGSLKPIVSIQNSKSDNTHDECLLKKQSENGLTHPLSYMEISRNPDQTTTSTYKSDIEFFVTIFRKISPMIVLIMILCIQSFFIFPGMVIHKRINVFREYFNETWNYALSWIFLFNFADSFGKFIALWPMKLRINTYRALIFLRFLFWGSFTMIYISPESSFLQNDWFCFAHLIAFGTSGGALMSGIILLASECGKSDEKETIGLIISIPLVYGHVIGCFIALFSIYI